MALTANTRGERLGDLCVSEIGLATQVDKRRRLEAARIAERRMSPMRMISRTSHGRDDAVVGDLQTASTGELHGGAHHRRARVGTRFVLWLGVTPYLTGAVIGVRIPTKPATHSDLKPAGVPI
jgi:hypothetical protein